MVGSAIQGSLAQRTGWALAEALRHDRGRRAMSADGRIRRRSDLLIEGVEDNQLPEAFDRSRLRSPDSSAALAINAFLPWQQAPAELPLGGWTGFDAIQFEVRCPTGLRGTPPHLDLLALRGQRAVAVTVRCCEYLSRRKSPIAASYDRLLAETPGVEAWLRQLERLRRAPDAYRHLDLGALIKFALALGRTFPDRVTTLLYLYWEPLDADAFEEFRRHRAELAGVASAVEGARITLVAQNLVALCDDWSARRSPSWLRHHVARLRARYCVALAPG